jgi:hypothetical protein
VVSLLHLLLSDSFTKILYTFPVYISWYRVTTLETGLPNNNCSITGRGNMFYLFYKASRQALELKKNFYSTGKGFFSGRGRLKRTERKFDHSSPFSAKVKNVCSSMFTFPYSFMACAGTTLSLPTTFPTHLKTSIIPNHLTLRHPNTWISIYHELLSTFLFLVPFRSKYFPQYFFSSIIKTTFLL